MSELTFYVGAASEWKAPGPNGGPARFKIGAIRVQVWPKVYGSDEDNPNYYTCRNVVMDGGWLKVGCAEKTRQYLAPDGVARKATDRTVVTAEAWTTEQQEADPKSLAEVVEIARAISTVNGASSKKLVNAGKEWEDRTPLIEACWAVGIAVNAPVILDADVVKESALRLLQIRDEVARERGEAKERASGPSEPDTNGENPLSEDSPAEPAN